MLPTKIDLVDASVATDADAQASSQEVSASRTGQYSDWAAQQAERGKRLVAEARIARSSSANPASGSSRAVGVRL